MKKRDTCRQKKDLGTRAYSGGTNLITRILKRWLRTRVGCSLLKEEGGAGEDLCEWVLGGEGWMILGCKVNKFKKRGEGRDTGRERRREGGLRKGQS